MGKAQAKFLVLAGVGASGILATIALPPLLAPSGASLISDSPKEVMDQAWQIVFRDYLDINGKYTPEQWRKLRRELLSKNYGSSKEAYEGIRGMLASLDDPYTRFLDPREFKEMQIDTSGELSGVGIQLSLDKDTKSLVVIAPIEGSPASRAGVQPKDLILAIDGKSTKGMSTETAVKLIRGEAGTTVNLSLKRNSEILDVALIRQRIELHAVEHHLNSTSDGRKVGYIRLKQFTATAARDMRLAINDLEAKFPDGYVLDLRSNPGGLLAASVSIAREWLNEGTIVSTKTRDGIQDIKRATGRAITDKPLVVLVNEGSASASEIVAAALQDNHRALLVGQKTFGKGLVQSVRGLSDGSGMTVTIAKYVTPSGRYINHLGIKPDVFVKMTPLEVKQLKIEDLGTLRDPQYRVAENTLVRELNALKASGITPARMDVQAYSPTGANLDSALPKN